MKKITLNNQDFIIPESWYDINLKQYQELSELEKTKKDRSDYNEEFLSVLLNVSKEKLFDLELKDFTDLFEFVHGFTTTPIPRPDDSFIKIKNKTFIFDKDIKGIKYGMYADLNNMTNTTEILNVANRVATIFIREVKQNSLILKLKKKLKLKIKSIDYDFEESKNNEELFLTELSLPYIIEVVGFFLNYQKRLEKIFQSSIPKR
jgi:hypothetical protein